MQNKWKVSSKKPFNYLINTHQYPLPVFKICCDRWGCFVTQSKVVPRLQTLSIPISNTYKTIFLSMKVSSLSSVVTTKNCWTQKKNFTGYCSRFGFNKGYDSYHCSRSISSQHMKQGSTHQSLVCTYKANIPERGRCCHLYCGNSSTGGNPLYRRCCGWRYWHIDLPYPSMRQLKKCCFL